MRQDQFLNLATIEEARARFESGIRLAPLETEPVAIDEALGRVLAEDVVSPEDVPGYHRSNMDGYAVVASDTYGADETTPVRLRVLGPALHPGAAPARAIEPGAAQPIATGAVVPRGANAIVMVEDTNETEGGAGVLVYRPAVPGRHIGFAGYDIMAGEVILRRGQVLGARETAVAAAAGFVWLPCVRRPEVAIVSTGNEIATVGAKLDEGQLHDVNGRAIADMVREAGGMPRFLGIVPDDEAALEAKLDEALASDAVLLSGGTSKSAGDLNYRVVERLGEPGILVHGVAIQPGKPLCLAAVGGKAVAVLPGFPVSAIVTFLTFIRPVLRRLAGLPPDDPADRIEARAALRIHSSPGRHEFRLVHLIHGKEGLAAYPLAPESGAVRAFAEADGYAEIPVGTEMIVEDTPIPVTLIGRRRPPAGLALIGSHCIGLDRIVSRLSAEGIECKAVNAGSTAGLLAAARGESDVAGCHLLDPGTLVYNVPAVRRERGLALVRGYRRSQGVILRPEDAPPAGAADGLAFLGRLATDPSKRLVNRTGGSGTRILLDSLLAGIARARGATVEDLVRSIPGYDLEARTHGAVAVSILHRKSDWGIGIEIAARIHGLAFVPLRDEEYDFVIPAQRLDRGPVLRFLALLRDPAVQGELRSLGFGLPEDIGTRVV